MIEAAGQGHYNPLTSKVPYAKKRLAEDCRLAGLKELAKEVEDGKFRATDDEAREFWSGGTQEVGETA